VADSDSDGRQAQTRVHNEFGVREWWTPLSRRRPEHSGPRVTEDGLKVPDWWTDDETESQQMLISQGVILDA
jgi:hypothetical protein